MDEEYDDYDNYEDIDAENLELKIEKYERIQKSMAKMIAPSESDFTSNYRVHRIVFENILVNPGDIPEGNDRSLSIPFDGKMRPVWAPNGYGKTFAFKMLSFLHVDPNEIWDNPFLQTIDSPPELFWTNFIQKCKKMLDSPEETTSVTNVYEIPIEIFKKSFNKSDIYKAPTQIFKNRLVPFVSMKIRLVGTAKNIDNQAEKKVVDISLVPSWSDGRFTLDKKFWSTESLDSLFFQKFADEELKSILIDEYGNSELSIRDPVFLKNSFVFPQCILDFHHFNQTNEQSILDQENHKINDNDMSQYLLIREQFEIYIADLLTETGEYYSEEELSNELNFSSEELKILVKLKDFYQLKKNEKEKLLLDFMELNDKYPRFISDEDMVDQNSKCPLAVLDGPEREMALGDFPKICTLLDLDINGVADILRFNLRLESIPGITVNLIHSCFPNTWSSWRTFPMEEIQNTLTYHGTHYESGSITEDESIMEAVRMLSTCYFEIPSLINYSSESNLNQSQEMMEYMLKSIRRESDEVMRIIAQKSISGPNLSKKHSTNEELLMSILKIVSQRLGGGRSNSGSVLDNFFGELDIVSLRSYDMMLNDLESRSERIIESIESITLFEPDFTDPIWNNIVTKIIKFTEIYENINETLDNVNTTSWSAMCRFGSLENSMRFSDPSNDFEIKQEHLSFGQRSVIVSEVCLGLIAFLDPKAGLLNYSSTNPPSFRPLADIQCNFIIDEPEIGRSEYWVNEVAKRIIETSNYLEENKSIMIVSHRESLLRSFNSDNMFYVMQPQESQNQEEE